MIWTTRVLCSGQKLTGWWWFWAQGLLAGVLRGVVVLGRWCSVAVLSVVLLLTALWKSANFSCSPSTIYTILVRWASSFSKLRKRVNFRFRHVEEQVLFWDFLSPSQWTSSDWTTVRSRWELPMFWFGLAWPLARPFSFTNNQAPTKSKQNMLYKKMHSTM